MLDTTVRSSTAAPGRPRQSARSVTEAINPSLSCHYFPPDPRLDYLLQSITSNWRERNMVRTAWPYSRLSASTRSRTRMY